MRYVRARHEVCKGKTYIKRYRSEGRGEGQWGKGKWGKGKGSIGKGRGKRGRRILQDKAVRTHARGMYAGHNVGLWVGWVAEVAAPDRRGRTYLRW